MVAVISFLSLLTLVAGIAWLIVVFDLVSFRFFNKKKLFYFTKLLSQYAVLCAFLVALVSMAGSLYISEVIGYAPCVLCWYQRIFMYPMVFLFGMALFVRDRTRVFTYGFVLSLVGLLISGYHYMLQLGIRSATCDVVGYSVSCAETFTTYYGYITIPMMAFTAFALVITLAYLSSSGNIRSKTAPHLV